ncbi:hypothetical protein L226DRAFT_85195 [Lentinus tigrinus ALCF2SS1-7]|uniref:uncharacterized protein n=1 Tax=Lentinus tigrinus ALCF2SS1-7 TaxID=1328758 RepID=UPI0011662C3D|nr:hypothetical protein L226DRAFT_85195 [Lentinus tigrinus ALCF2SS1-7]
MRWHTSRSSMRAVNWTLFGTSARRSRHSRGIARPSNISSSRADTTWGLLIHTSHARPETRFLQKASPASRHFIACSPTWRQHVHRYLAHTTLPGAAGKWLLYTGGWTSTGMTRCGSCSSSPVMTSGLGNLKV